MRRAGGLGSVVPQAGLDFPDVRATEQEHAQTGLADATADGVGKLAVEQQAVEVGSAAVVAFRDGQLTIQRLGAYADAHRGKLEGTA